MDDDGSKALNEEEFISGIRDTGLDVTEEEIKQMFQTWVTGVKSGPDKNLIFVDTLFRFDEDGSGSINMTEFLLKLRVSWIFIFHYLLLNGNQQKITNTFIKCNLLTIF